MSLTSKRVPVEDSADAINQLYYDKGWTDGLPIVCPTEERVLRMLRYSDRQPGDVAAEVAPLYGEATVEKIAINAVMAGCKPEHLPVLIAAVKAIASPRFMLRDAAVSTGGRAPLLLINGPVAQRLWINSGVCALGPGVPSRANTAIGRAFRLIFMNIAGACPGKTDPNTVGLPTKYSLCVAENEQRSPWEPYHVELGYTRDASTVTVKSVYGCTETHDSRSTTPEGIADVAVSAARYTGSPALADWLRGGTSDPDSGLEVYAQHMWLICPDHAATMARGGWSKRDIREYLWRKATITFRVLTTRRELHKDAQGRWTKRPELQWLEDHPDLELPILASPDSFRLAVVGGPGPRGVFFWGNEEAVTEPIEE